MENEVLGLVKNNPNILASIYGDLAQPSVKKLGIALETVFEFSTSFLLPLKLRNEKVRLNFEKNLNDLKSKLENVPDEELCDVNPQIGTPIIEKLTYVTNDEIADLFTTLLLKASVTSTINQAHPAFVQMIEMLSVDEARIIKSLVGAVHIPWLTFTTEYEGNKYRDIILKATMLPINLDLIFKDDIMIYTSNLLGLGILKESLPDLFLPDNNSYSLIEKTYADSLIIKSEKSKKEFVGIELNKGYYEITPFGRAFIKACIL